MSHRESMTKDKHQEFELSGVFHTITAPHLYSESPNFTLNLWNFEVMSLPRFASFPDAKVRKNILPDEWQLYLESWTSLAELYLRLGDAQFSSASKEGDTLTSFLLSFFHELAHDDELGSKVSSLRKSAFFLLHRLFSRDDVPASLLSWSALADVCHAFPKSEQFRTLLQSLWTRNGSAIEKSLQTAKTSLIRNLESKRPEEVESTLNRIAPLLKASSNASMFLLTGSDFLDAQYEAYPRVPQSMQKKLVTIAYLGLTAALEGPKPNYSLLSDHLYSLKTSEEQEQKKEPGKKTLVADLVTNTPILEKIREKATAPEAARVKNTAASLSAFRQSSAARPKRLVRRKVDKGKATADQVPDNYGHGAFTGEVHVHRMSIITQIQDLFPDLGAGFIVKLLDEFNDDIEQVTAHLLEDILPPYLAEADRSEKLYVLFTSIELNHTSSYLQTSDQLRPQHHIKSHHQDPANNCLNAVMCSITTSSTSSRSTLLVYTLAAEGKTSTPTRSSQTVAKHQQNQPS
jgi:activating signal cointegrator complex subunit 2